MSAGREIQQQFCTLHTSLEEGSDHLYIIYSDHIFMTCLTLSLKFSSSLEQVLFLIIAIAYRTGVKISDFIWYNSFEPEVFAPLSFAY